MKKVILSAALLSITFSFAQKKEIAAAVKAIDGGDTSTASSQIAAAEAALGGKTYLLEPSLLEQYYYAKGLSLFKSGKKEEGASYLSKVGDLGKSKFYTGKNGKEKVYYFGKSAADASGVSGLKEESYTPTLSNKLIQELNPVIQATNKEALAANESKNYSVAGAKFQELYNLLKAVGQDDKLYLYYSGIEYRQAKENDKAIQVYKQLIDDGYTGVTTNYLAKNEKTGQFENIGKSNWELFKKATGSGYTDFKTETTPSVEEDLYQSLVALQIDGEAYNDAITYAEKGLKKFPKNARLSELKGLAYYKSGRNDEFIASLKDVVSKNPNDKVSWYNLGVVTKSDPSKKEEAIGYFKKATEIDPKYAEAWQNLSFLTIGDDDKTLEEYNTLRKSGKIDEANKVIEARRTRIRNTIPYAEKWYESDPNNIDAVSFLRSLYSSTQNTTKAAEMKAKHTALEAAQGK